jgi:acyl-CoA synthetase (NDP forming)
MTYGIPVTRPYVAKTVEKAVQRAPEIGYPVVLKIVSPEIVHKSDVGGVAVGIESEKQLRDAYEQLIESVKEKASEARIEGVAVQKMIEDIDMNSSWDRRRTRILAQSYSLVWVGSVPSYLEILQLEYHR